MRLNTIKPGAGSKPSSKRVGRGVGSGLGKTGGRGQKSRSGGYNKVGFEGGQMPLQRRLPKVGFKSRIGRTRAEVRLDELARIEADVIDLAALKAANVVGQQVDKAKVILSGELNRAVTLKGVAVTKGARAAVEAAGGKVED